MPANIKHTPGPFTPAVEKRAEDESETIQGLNEQIRVIQETTAKDYGTAVRGVHAKGHAIVRGKLEGLSDIAPALAQGLFSAPGTYDALLRFSTLPGDILDDSVSVPRGLAVKLFGVPGDRLPGSEADTTQDFILVNGPAFAAPTPKAFLANLKMLAKTTDSGEGLKKGLSAVLQTVDAALETVGIQSPTIQTLGGIAQSDGARRQQGRRVRPPRRAARGHGAGADRAGQHLGITRAALHQSREDAGRGLLGGLGREGEPVRGGRPAHRARAARLGTRAQRAPGAGGVVQPVARARRPSADRRRQPCPQADLRDVAAVPRPAQRLRRPRASLASGASDAGHDDRVDLAIV